MKKSSFIHPALGRLCFPFVATVPLLLTQCGDKPVAPVADKNEALSSRVKGEVTRYDQGRYGALLSGGGRMLLPKNEEEKTRVQALLARLNSEGLSKGTCEAVLAEARTLETEAMLDVVKALLASPEADIRAQALMMLDGAESGAVLPALEQGMKDADLDVRRLAMELALTVQSPMVEGMVTRGMADKDETIRQTALQVGLRQGGVIAERTLASGLGSPHEDLGAASLALLENELSKARMPLALGALDHPSLSVREDARDMLFFLFHERFPDRATAQAWWERHQAEYDENLVLNEAVLPATEPSR